MKNRGNKWWCRIVISAAITSGLIALAAPAAAADNIRVNIKGNSARASFHGSDPSDPDCVFMGTEIYATNGAFQIHYPPGPPNSEPPQSYVSAFIVQVDVCENTLLQALCLETPLSDTQFQVNGPNLKGVTLNTTLSCETWPDGNIFDISVEMTWTSFGPTFRGHTNTHWGVPGAMFTSRSSGSYREAEASGIVSDGIINFTPDPSSYAWVENSKSGSVNIFSY